MVGAVADSREPVVIHEARSPKTKRLIYQIERQPADRRFFFLFDLVPVREDQISSPIVPRF